MFSILIKYIVLFAGLIASASIFAESADINSKFVNINPPQGSSRSYSLVNSDTDPTIFENIRILGDIPASVDSLITRSASKFSAISGSELAKVLTAQLRQGGYPVAQVLYLPKDQLPTNPKVAVLRIYLGNVGKVFLVNTSAVGDDTLAQQANQAVCPDQPAGIGSSCVLESKNLERAVSLLKLNPGVADVQVSLSADGVGVGETAIRFTVTGSRNLTVGFLSIDNYGVPSTGQTRYGATIGANSLIRPGDIFYLSVFGTNENSITGLVNWNQLLNSDGLRLESQYTRSQVISPLGSTQVQGVANAISFGLSHPLTLLMNQQQILDINIGNTYVTNELVGVAQIQNRQIPFLNVGLSANTGPASGLDFASWTLRATVGKPSDSAAGVQAQDEATSQVLNTFGKLYGQFIKRKQVGDTAFNLGLNLRGQGANRNLDSTMMLPFGGVDAARAYPVNEGAYSSGMVASADIRFAAYENDGVRLYTSIFSDYLVGQTYKNTWNGWNGSNPALQNTRHLSDYGLGVSIYFDGFLGQFSYARKYAQSEQSVVSPTAANGRFWLTGSWSWK